MSGLIRSMKRRLLPAVFFFGTLLGANAAPPPSLAFDATDIDGKSVSLGDYAGKVLLVVNTASQCGQTPQYAKLQALHEKYADKGLRILAFPSNDFGGQEPGSNAEIKKFCADRYGVGFDLFGKTGVAGEKAHPFFKFLTNPETNPRFFGKLKWNFEKFVIARDGKVANRFRSFHEPDNDTVLKTIEWELETDPKARAKMAEKDGPGPPSYYEYTGRQVAMTMGWKAANWLIRETRENEEKASVMMAQLGIKPGMNIADIGVGNGFHAIPMARMVGDKGRIYGVDVQHQMIELLQIRARQAGVKNIVPIHNSYWDAMLPEKSVDLAIMVDVYHEFSHPETMLASVRKALRPGGRIALLEFRMEHPDVPIKRLHKMSKTQIMREYQANGFKLVGEYNELPWQHMMFFASTDDDTQKAVDHYERYLFDGETLAGWTDASGKPPGNGWVVERGTIHRRAKSGDLYTAEEFGDFDLSFQWKVAKGSNSGVKYRLAKYDGAILGPEYQLIDDDGQRPKGSTAAIYDILPPSPKKKLKPVGGWNTTRIVAKGTRFEHWLNGEKVLDVDTTGELWKNGVANSKFKNRKNFAQNPKGRIMLQDHGNPVWFRHITIKELASPGSP